MQTYYFPVMDGPLRAMKAAFEMAKILLGNIQN